MFFQIAKQLFMLGGGQEDVSCVITTKDGLIHVDVLATGDTIAIYRDGDCPTVFSLKEIADKGWNS